MITFLARWRMIGHMIPSKPLSLIGKLLLAAVIALLALGLFIAAATNFARYQRVAEERREAAPTAASPLDATYLVDGEAVALKNAEAQWPSAPESAPVKIRVFSVAAQGDLDGDGIDDAAVLLVKEAGGSGTFFYAAAALKRGDAYQGTNAVLLGDRIAPNTTNIWDGVLVHDYATRNPDEPMTARPSLGQSIYLRVTDGALRETADRPRP